MKKNIMGGFDDLLKLGDKPRITETKAQKRKRELIKIEKNKRRKKQRIKEEIAKRIKEEKNKDIYKNNPFHGNLSASEIKKMFKQIEEKKKKEENKIEQKKIKGKKDKFDLDDRTFLKNSSLKDSVRIAFDDYTNKLKEIKKAESSGRSSQFIDYKGLKATKNIILEIADNTMEIYIDRIHITKNSSIKYIETICDTLDEYLSYKDIKSKSEIRSFIKEIKDQAIKKNQIISLHNWLVNISNVIDNIKNYVLSNKLDSNKREALLKSKISLNKLKGSFKKHEKSLDFNPDQEFYEPVFGLPFKDLIDIGNKWFEPMEALGDLRNYTYFQKTLKQYEELLAQNSTEGFIKTGLKYSEIDFEKKVINEVSSFWQDPINFLKFEWPTNYNDLIREKEGLKKDIPFFTKQEQTLGKKKKKSNKEIDDLVEISKKLKGKKDRFIKVEKRLEEGKAYIGLQNIGELKVMRYTNEIINGNLSEIKQIEVINKILNVVKGNHINLITEYRNELLKLMDINKSKEVNTKIVINKKSYELEEIKNKAFALAFLIILTNAIHNVVNNHIELAFNLWKLGSSAPGVIIEAIKPENELLVGLPIVLARSLFYSKVLIYDMVIKNSSRLHVTLSGLPGKIKKAMEIMEEINKNEFKILELQEMQKLDPKNNNINYEIKKLEEKNLSLDIDFKKELKQEAQETKGSAWLEWIKKWKLTKVIFSPVTLTYNMLTGKVDEKKFKRTKSHFDDIEKLESLFNNIKEGNLDNLKDYKKIITIQKALKKVKSSYIMYINTQWFDKETMDMVRYKGGYLPDPLSYKNVFQTALHDLGILLKKNITGTRDNLYILPISDGNIDINFLKGSILWDAILEDQELYEKNIKGTFNKDHKIKSIVNKGKNLIGQANENIYLNKVLKKTITIRKIIELYNDTIPDDIYKQKQLLETKKIIYLKKRLNPNYDLEGISNNLDMFMKDGKKLIKKTAFNYFIMKIIEGEELDNINPNDIENISYEFKKVAVSEIKKTINAIKQTNPNYNEEGVLKNLDTFLKKYEKNKNTITKAEFNYFIIEILTGKKLKDINYNNTKIVSYGGKEKVLSKVKEILNKIKQTKPNYDKKGIEILKAINTIKAKEDINSNYNKKSILNTLGEFLEKYEKNENIITKEKFNYFISEIIEGKELKDIKYKNSKKYNKYYVDYYSEYNIDYYSSINNKIQTLKKLKEEYYKKSKSFLNKTGIEILKCAKIIGINILVKKDGQQSINYEDLIGEDYNIEEENIDQKEKPKSKGLRKIIELCQYDPSIDDIEEKRIMKIIKELEIELIKEGGKHDLYIKFYESRLKLDINSLVADKYLLDYVNNILEEKDGEIKNLKIQIKILEKKTSLTQEETSSLKKMKQELELKRKNIPKLDLKYAKENVNTLNVDDIANIRKDIETIKRTSKGTEVSIESQGDIDFKRVREYIKYCVDKNPSKYNMMQSNFKNFIAKIELGLTHKENPKSWIGTKEHAKIILYRIISEKNKEKNLDVLLEKIKPKDFDLEYNNAKTYFESGLSNKMESALKKLKIQIGNKIDLFEDIKEKKEGGQKGKCYEDLEALRYKFNLEEGKTVQLEKLKRIIESLKNNILPEDMESANIETIEDFKKYLAKEFTNNDVKQLPKYTEIKPKWDAQSINWTEDFKEGGKHANITKALLIEIASKGNEENFKDLYNLLKKIKTGDAGNIEGLQKVTNINLFEKYLCDFTKIKEIPIINDALKKCTRIKDVGLVVFDQDALIKYEKVMEKEKLIEKTGKFSTELKEVPRLGEFLRKAKYFMIESVKHATRR